MSGTGMVIQVIKTLVIQLGLLRIKSNDHLSTNNSPSSIIIIMV